MLYKKPIITLTSLLDLLFILIFAYQMDIKTDAEKYVQAEVSKRVLQNVPDQKELIAELQAENKRVRDKLESIKDKTREVLDDQLQAQKYYEQAERLRGELDKKERELVAVKQENKRIKEQSKSKDVISVTDKDAELAKALVGTWRGSDTYRGIDRSYRTKLNPDKSYIDSQVITANRNVIFEKQLRLNKGESISVNTTGSWWVKGSYIHFFLETSTNTKVFPIGHSSSQKILSVDRNTSRFQNDDGSISTDYRVNSN